MSLLSLSCAMILQASSPCPASAPVPVEPAAFATAAIPDSELDATRGAGLDPVGIDQLLPASRSRYVDVAFNDVRTSNEVREVVDNWNVAVAVPLIAQAVADARR